MQAARRIGRRHARLRERDQFPRPQGREAALPTAGSVDELRELAAACLACDLWRNATQTVFGESPPAARVLVVGERRDQACRPWLEAEVARIRPELIVCLGATAARALLGRSFRVTQQHGEVVASDLGPTLATIHPSAILRAPDDARGAAYDGMVADLRAAAAHLGRA